MSKDYTSTLNLPVTEFSMRANLPQREPETLAYWDEIDLYHQMLKNAEGKPMFVLHDGPPFSNNNIHMGTAMNKILKDFINKIKVMKGYYVPYVPGWDNHGMPIESAIIKQNKIDRKKMSIAEFRSRCHEFAMHFVEVQRDQFIRLGVTGDWKNPYLTMAPSFEAREVKVFGEMYKKGYIYKGMKPVYWCPKDETALAEAEIEYATDKCTSIFVKFELTKDNGLFFDAAADGKVYVIIWTTTTWTLPGNVAIAVHPDENYALVKAGREYYVVAEPLVSKVMSAGQVKDYEIIKSVKGSEMEYMECDHPFLPRKSVVVNAPYVTMDSGTGCVHTAPGFGADDFVTGRRYNLDFPVPVDDRGYQTEEAGPYAGMFYEESNAAILHDLTESGALFASEEMEHEYPHCWRCKNPIIFRATPQWFCSVDAFKEEAVKACDDVEWIPAWGKDRIVSMVRERADWCISRQRHWGLPIPVFYCEDCGKPICNDETIEQISKLFGESGSNIWFEKEASELLPKSFKCPHCGGTHFSKEGNTLDGWFDSGSSHFATLKEKTYGDLRWPADIYLEGGDQYRGWFQSSLLTAVGAEGKGAPYKTVLTHGWTVDGEGRAMHKSLGNTVSPDEMVKKYGGDLVRMWVASSDYHVDVRCSDAIFKQLSDIYRKIRNTARIMLANLNDYDPSKDAVAEKEMLPLDLWIMARMNDMIKECSKAYDRYEFHVAYHAINRFCTIDMSKLYIDITKDRMYTSEADSVERRSAQTALYYVLSGMTRLLAPLISFTAEEIWRCMKHVEGENEASVFLNPLPEYDAAFAGRHQALKDGWDHLFELRDDVMKALELARAEKMIGKSLDAKVDIYTTDEKAFKTLDHFAEDLATVFITSGAKVHMAESPEGAFTETDSGIGVVVSGADGCKCDRCWSYSVSGIKTEDGFLCDRCRKILKL
ncbi:MAG: isoleucine--tRNA ligase [Clostridia bacterium]|nr:isoleucine--tRNA ligase [Clostridia bacterium]